MKEYKESLLQYINPEGIAITFGASRSCTAHAIQYAENHRAATDRIIKDLCDEKIKAVAIFRYSGEQLINRILMMAAAYVAASQNDKQFFIDLVNTYLKNQRQEKLRSIERSEYHAVFERIKEAPENDDIATKHFANAQNIVAAEEGFYPYFLFYEARQEVGFSETVTRAIQDNARKMCGNSLFRVRQMFNDKDNTFAAMGKFAEKHFFGVIGTTYESFTKYATQQMKEEDSHSGIPIDKIKAIGETARCVTVFLGVVSDADLSAVYFSKECRQQISFTAYAALIRLYPIDEISQAIILTEQDIDKLKQDPEVEITISSERAKEIEDKLIELLAVTTNLFAFGLQYKKSRLQQVRDTFFNPQGQKRESELRSTKKKLEAATTELAEQKKQNKALRAEAKEAVAAAETARNRYASIQSKIERQETDNKALLERIQALEKENARLKELVPQDPEPQPEEAAEEPEPIDYRAALTDIFHAKKIVFVGGHQNIMGKFSKRYPDAIAIPQNRVPFAEQQIVQADALLFKTDSMGHKEYTPVKAIAERNNIPVAYVGNFANVELMEQDVYQQLEKLRFVKEEAD